MLPYASNPLTQPSDLPLSSPLLKSKLQNINTIPANLPFQPTLLHLHLRPPRILQFLRFDNSTIGQRIECVNVGMG